MNINLNVKIEMGTVFWENIFAVASLQGYLSHTIYSIYAINEETFTRFCGFDPGRFLFANMLYGTTMLVYSRPVMNRLKGNYRVLFSMHKAFAFTYSSALVFLLIRNWYPDSPGFMSVCSFFVGKFMYSVFASYLYFVDYSADRTLRRHSVIDHMMEETA